MDRSFNRKSVLHGQSRAGRYFREKYGIEAEKLQIEYVTIGLHKSYPVVHIWDGGVSYAVYFNKNLVLIPHGDNVRAVEMSRSGEEILEKYRGLLADCAPSIQDAVVSDFYSQILPGNIYPPAFENTLSLTTLSLTMYEIPDLRERDQIYAFLLSLREIVIDQLSVSVFTPEVVSHDAYGNDMRRLVGFTTLRTDLSRSEMETQIETMTGKTGDIK